MAVCLLANSWSPERLTLKVAVAPKSLKTACVSSITVDVKLTFFNTTAPTCGQLKLEKLCFPDRDINPHIKENRMPGALRQLRRFTHADLCPNYTISYRLVAGTIKNKSSFFLWSAETITHTNLEFKGFINHHYLSVTDINHKSFILIPNIHSYLLSELWPRNILTNNLALLLTALSWSEVDKSTQLHYLRKSTDTASQMLLQYKYMSYRQFFLRLKYWSTCF